MLTSSRGGVALSDVNEVTVMPVMSSTRPAVMTTTPPARRRITERNWRSISSVSSTRWISALLIGLFLRRRLAPAVLWLEEALGGQRRAADLVLPNRARLVGGRVVR